MAAAGLKPTKQTGRDLGQAVEKILDKGLVINADISVSVSGEELLGIKARAALASFETAAKYGLEFPSGTDLNAPGWEKVGEETAFCPECGNKASRKELLEKGCLICGWQSPRKPRQAPVP